MPKTLFIIAILLIYILHFQSIQAQETLDSSNHIAQIIYLDSMVVVAKKQGFKVSDFIHLVRTDTTFYTAFKNLRILNYQFTNDIRMTYFQSNNLVTFKNVCQQKFEKSCRWMECDQPTIQGQYYKNKKPMYLTGKLYEKLFFTNEKTCNQPKTSVTSDFNSGKSWRVDPTNQIKIIMFSPGRKSTLPIIGKKMDIFSEDMNKYYDYAILSSEFQEEPCYIFSIKLKPKYHLKRKNKTVVKHLETYFNKADFQIVYRSYHLKHKSAIVNFDINMQVELADNSNIYYPKNIQFEGFWDVPTKKPEQSKFQLKISQVSDE